MRINSVALTLLMACSFIASKAQVTADEKAIKLVIDKLFTGMHKGDSTMVRESFTKEVTLATVYRNKSNEVTIHHESSLKDFLKAVGTPHNEVWNEEYWNLKIQTDGDFATAWCDYAFYLNDTFSHCGVDAFHFINTKDGWRIFHLADTRRKEGCKIPPQIQAKHKG